MEAELDTAITQAEAVRRGEVSARQLAEAALARIEASDAELGAAVAVVPEVTLAAADAVDAAVAAGEDPGPLAGVPFGVKDLDTCAGFPTTEGSLWFVDRPPSTADSIHVARLRAAGAVPVAMTAAPEFGTVAFTSTKAHGTTRNPWDLERTPGGSSGGSAAMVAAGLTAMATASDGGGSTRIPASFSGLVGHKPSFGRIPSEHATTSQTAVKGVLTTTVADTARALDVTAGPDDRDRTSLPATGISFERAIEELDVSDLRIGWSGDLGFAVVDPEVSALTRAAAERLAAAAGVELFDATVDLGDPTRAWMTSSAIDQWLHVDRDHESRLDELMPSVRRGYDQTLDWPGRRYVKVLRDRTELEARVARVYEEVDVLCTPATAVVAFAAAGPPPGVIDGQEVHAGMSVPFTMVANLCWNPACSVPAGLTAAGLPIGLQVMGRRHDDATVLRLARLAEQTWGWPRTAPGWPRAAA